MREAGGIRLNEIYMDSLPDQTSETKDKTERHLVITALCLLQDKRRIIMATSILRQMRSGKRF